MTSRRCCPLGQNFTGAAPFRGATTTTPIEPNNFTYLLVELEVGEYRVDAPRFREHGAKGQTKAGHEEPRAGRANVWESGDTTKATVQAQEYDAHVGEHAADDD